MGLYAHDASAWRGNGSAPFAEPWVKRPDGVWVTGQVMYRKKDDNSGWTEVWPLLPGVASGLSMATPYRNNRIEADFSWAAPSSGVAVAQYNIVVYLNGSPYYSTSLAAGTTSFTLTNNGAGFQSSAGAGLSFTVQAQTAEGVKGAVVGSGTLTISNVPPPPAVYNLTGSISEGNVYYQFNATPDARQSQIRVQVHLPGIAIADYYFGSTDFVGSTQSPYNGAYVNGGTVYVTVWAQGPGGSSPQAQIALVIPSDIPISGYRFSTGTMTFYMGGASGTSYADIYAGYPGGENYVGNYPIGNQYNVPGSNGWGTGAYYRAMVIPHGANGTGRRQYFGQIKKIPNPYEIKAEGVATYQAGINQWVDPLGTYTYQGATFAGYYYGHGFFGNRFRDELNDSLLGYHINPSSFHIWMGRTSEGGGQYIGPAYALPIRLYLHQAGNQGEANLNFGGGPAGNVDFGYDDFKYVAMPEYWARMLIDQTQGWKGLGIYDGNPSGDISRYFDQTRSAYHDFWSVLIYHDG